MYEKVMIQIDKQAGEYEERRDSALRRLRGDMQRNFSLNGGMLVDWIKLNRYVSAECPPPP